MARIKPDWSAYDVHFDKYLKTWRTITYVVLYCRYAQTVVELLFFYVVVRNWLHKPRKMSSIFFVLFTLRLVNDFVSTVFIELDLRKWVNLKNSVLDDNEYYDAFTLEFDTVLHIFICLNRFTAIMFPFSHNKIWTLRNNVLVLCLVAVLTGFSSYLDVQFYREFDYLRTVLCLACVLVLVLSIIFRRKSQGGTSKFVKKSDRQLLYDTVFTATAMVVTNVNYIFLDTNPYMSFETFFVLASFDDFVYNSFFAVSIVFLFYISTAARDGLKLAIPWCGMWKTETEQRGISHMTRVTTVLPTNRTWLTPIK